jgi:hypothetical protein
MRPQRGLAALLMTSIAVSHLDPLPMALCAEGAHAPVFVARNAEHFARKRERSERGQTIPERTA